jgi:hypothetical protein
LHFAGVQEETEETKSARKSTRDQNKKRGNEDTLVHFLTFRRAGSYRKYELSQQKQPIKSVCVVFL